MPHLRYEVFAQRRFRQLLVIFMTLSFLLGLLIVPIEQGQGYFKTWGDGLWWSATTVTGVGYGDLVPVTKWGRVIGVILQATGVAMLGLMIGIVTDLLSRRQENMFWKREFNQFDEIHDRLDRIERQLHYVVRSHVAIDESSDPAQPKQE